MLGYLLLTEPEQSHFYHHDIVFSFFDYSLTRVNLGIK